MANVYGLTATSISTSSIVLTIVPGAATGTLAAADFIIKKFDGTDAFDTLTITTQYTVNPVSQIAATINFVEPAAAIDTGSLLLIQINSRNLADDGDEDSDRVMVDFSEAYDDVDHDATYKYELPAEIGSYKMQLDTVNGNTEDADSAEFNTVETEAFTVGNAPQKGNCSIEVAKDYLVKYTGQVLDLTVVINNAAGDVPVGNYEVSIDADLQ